MIRVSDIRIGTKLGIMSGLSIALVAGMLASTVYSSSQVGASNAKAVAQQDILRDITKIEMAFLNTRLAMRNIRLATTAEELTAANTLAPLRDTVDKLVQGLMPRFKVPANRERAEKVRGFIDQYIDLTQQDIVPVKIEALKDAAKDPARALALVEQTQKIQHERLDPVSNQALALLKEIGDVATGVAAQESDNAAQEMAFAENLAVGIGLSVIAILIGSAVFSVFSIARPLRALVAPLAEVAGGNFAVAVPGVGRKDEVGLIASAAEAVAERVGATIGNIKLAATEVTSASAEISTSTTDLSQRTEEQAASLEETSASMEEISATVKKNAENARQANDFAIETSEVAERGGAVISDAVTAMARIEESSRKISDIISVIDEIARQTNLLALNAAVEAARAGEAGRGFAVVASEVRSLAQRSSQAAKDIKDLIMNSNSQVKDGVDLVNKAGQSLNEIVTSIKKVTTIVADIANASMEQSSGIEQVNKALTQMDEVTQQNSALVEENAATAKTLEQQARSMDERVAAFRLRANAAREAYAGAPGDAGEAEAVRIAPVVTRTAPRRTAAMSMRAFNRGGPVGRMQTALAAAVEAEPETEEF
jgi:methyl-accepting chemotaxis protein